MVKVNCRDVMLSFSVEYEHAGHVFTELLLLVCVSSHQEMKICVGVCRIGLVKNR